MSAEDGKSAHTNNSINGHDVSVPLLSRAISTPEVSFSHNSNSDNSNITAETSLSGRSRNRRISFGLADNFKTQDDKFIPPHLLSYSDGERGNWPRGNNFIPSRNNKKPEPNPDIAAMSVLSLYESAEDMDDEMDTSR